MKYDPAVHRRRSIRLREYDYAQAGAYFVTICAQDRQCLFGEIVDGGMRLNAMGRIVAEQWDAIPRRFTNVALGAFVVMSNHIHGIFFNLRGTPRGRPHTGRTAGMNISAVLG